MYMYVRKILSHKLSISVFGVCAVLAIGCSSSPPRELTTQLAKTDSSIAQAEQAGAAQGGLAELQQAKDKRASAEEALTDHKYDLSMQLAQQAQVDAQLASNRAQAKQARRSASEVSRSTETLRDETLRNTDEAARASDEAASARTE
jgi:hypothetical protein